MKTNPNAPAFPFEEHNYNGELFVSHGGLSIRAEIASRMMASIIANLNSNTAVGVPHPESNTNIAMASIALADALIAELNKEHQE